MTVAAEVDTPARLRLDQIKAAITSAAELLTTVGELITQAREAGDHEALGFTSLEAYYDDALGGLSGIRMDRETRQVIVGKLFATGLSRGSIANVTGVPKSTVHRDIAASGVPDGTPERVTGPDGKSYPAANPKPAPTPVEGTALDLDELDRLATCSFGGPEMPAVEGIAFFAKLRGGMEHEFGGVHVVELLNVLVTERGVSAIAELDGLVALLTDMQKATRALLRVAKDVAAFSDSNALAEDERAVQAIGRGCEDVAAAYRAIADATRHEVSETR